MEAVKEEAKMQSMLDGIFQKVSGPKEFTKDHLLDTIARFIACNDQVCKPFLADEYCLIPFVPVPRSC